ncbi:unnamed protein product [Malus baccata var. baccata]
MEAVKAFEVHTFPVEGILNKLALLAAQEFSLFRGFRKELAKFRQSIRAIQEFLGDVTNQPQQDRGMAVRDWLKKLEEVARDADNVFDEINYEDIRSKVELQNQVKKKVLNFLSRSNPILFRQQMAHKIKNINATLADLKSEASFIGLVARRIDSTLSPQGMGNRETVSSFDHDEKIFGREEIVSGIIATLVDSNNQEKYLSVMVIVGMAGLGKTTLAKSIYNDNRYIDKHFETKIWVCVSTTFDVNSILRRILELLNSTNTGLTSQEALLQNLQKELMGKRYILVLDDVWNEDDMLWSNLMSCLSKLNSAHGSVMIITTRSVKVASITETLPRCDLVNLSIEDCWSILKGEAFPYGCAPLAASIHERIGRAIAEKCAVVVATAVRMLGGGNCANKGHNDMWWWVGGGGGGHSMHKLKCVGAEFYGYNYVSSGATTTTRNETVRRVILFPALKTLQMIDCPVLVEWNEAVVAMPTNEKVELVVFPCLEKLTLVSCMELRTAPGHFPSLQKLDVYNVDNFMAIENISSQLTALTSLRLEYLQELTSLPVGILEKNQKLLIRGCPNLTSIPISRSPSLVEYHSSLQELSIVDCPKLRCISIHSLTTLRKLAIERCSLESTNLQSGLEELSLYGCTSLRELRIEECNGFTSILSGLQSCTSLRSFFISKCQSLKRLGRQYPVSLEHLVISGCPNLRAIPSLDNLTSLRYLEIEKCDAITSLPSELSSCISLSHFLVKFCDKIKSMADQDVSSLQSLSCLVIYECLKLQYLPRGLHSLHGLKEMTIGKFWKLDSFPDFEVPSSQIQSLTISGWRKLKSLPDQIQHFTTLTSLEIRSFGRVESLPEWLGDLTSLTQLRIKRCKNLMYFPTVEAMQRITKLHVLEIDACPHLKEACAEESGREWPKISRIPHKRCKSKYSLFLLVKQAMALSEIFCILGCLAIAFSKVLHPFLFNYLFFIFEGVKLLVSAHVLNFISRKVAWWAELGRMLVRCGMGILSCVHHGLFVEVLDLKVEPTAVSEHVYFINALQTQLLNLELWKSLTLLLQQ